MAQLINNILLLTTLTWPNNSGQGAQKKYSVASVDVKIKTILTTPKMP